MLDDLRYALRSLFHARGFAAAAILTVALAIGANTAVFSVADAVLFRPLPYDDPDNLFVVQMTDPVTSRRSALVRWDYLRAIRESHDSLGDVATLEAGPRVVAVTPDGSENVPTSAVSANYFEVFRTRAARGRLFVTSDAASAGRTAVLSHEAWTNRFGRDEGIVGRPIMLGTERFDIVGILPPGFFFPSPLARRPDLVVVHDVWDGEPNSGGIYPVVRLDPGATLERAQVELARVSDGVRRDNPALGPSMPVLVDLRSLVFPTGRPMMRFLVAAAMLVLLLGCANLANLFLARAARREHDLGVRAALGASGRTLAQPVIFEALIVALAGAALAFMGTALSFDALRHYVPPVAYGAATVGVDARVAVFALVLGCTGGALLAAAAAWKTSRHDIVALIHRRASGTMSVPQRFGSPMIAVQIAVALVLVFGATVAARAFVSVLQVPLAFTPDDVVTVLVSPPSGSSGSQRQDLYLRVIGRLAARSEVMTVGAAASLPLSAGVMFEGISGPDGQRTIAGVDHALPGFFETIGARLLQGRLLDAGDLRGDPDVAVVSQAAARILFPDSEPVGATFRVRSGREFRVVGLIADIRGQLEPEVPAAYVLPGDDTRVMTVVARMRAHDGALLSELRRETNAVASGQPVEVRWWSDSLGDLTVYRNPRFQTMVLGSFAALALVLTGTGVFGLISFLVANRLREMGIRAAVGATPRRLTSLIVRQVATPVVIGLVLGLGATRGLARLAEAQLYEVDTRNPLILAAATMTVLATAFIAAYIPAHRVCAVDPVVRLRTE